MRMRHCCKDFEIICYKELVNDYAQNLFNTSREITYAIEDLNRKKEKLTKKEYNAYVYNREVSMQRLFAQGVSLRGEIDKYPPKYVLQCPELFREVIGLQAERDALFQLYNSYGAHYNAPAVIIL